MPTGGGEESRILDSTICDGPFAVANEGIYFFKNSDKENYADLCVFQLATGKTRKIVTSKNRCFAVSGNPP